MDGPRSRLIWIALRIRFSAFTPPKATSLPDP
jgi:hypothetical protein